jgi:hypothetical protein
MLVKMWSWHWIDATASGVKAPLLCVYTMSRELISRMERLPTPATATYGFSDTTGEIAVGNAFSKTFLLLEKHTISKRNKLGTIAIRKQEKYQLITTQCVDNFIYV